MTENSSFFTLTDVADVIARRFKIITAFVAVVVAATAVLVFFLPQFYSSTTIAVAANPTLADKARLFNPNIEGLYSSFGTSDDLDRLYGIARLDTIYGSLVDQFDLVSYYKAKGSTAAKARRNAILQLQDDITVEKNELNQISITVWNKDPQWAANIANTMMSMVEGKVQTIWQAGYSKALNQFDTAINRLQQEFDSMGLRGETLLKMPGSPVNNDFLLNQRAEILQQLKEYRRIRGEFRVAQANTSPALIVLEAASAAPKPGKPKKLVLLLAAFLLSSFFGVLAALVYDRKSAIPHA